MWLRSIIVFLGRHAAWRCKICPDSMFQKWQLWTKLHKFEKTAQLASSAGSQSLLAGPPQLNTIWDNSGTKRETATVSTKFEGPRRWDGQQDKGEAEGWLAWLQNIYTLCVSIYPLSRIVTRHTWHVMWAPDAKSANHLDHSLLWEEGGIFWLLKVHLLQIQQVLVSNEGNDECFCWDELACAVQGVATVKSQNLPSEP